MSKPTVTRVASATAPPAAKSDGAKPGPSSPSRSLRIATVSVALALVWVGGLSTYKQWALTRLAADSAQALESKHPAVLALFQAGFYFYYADQFVPGIRDTLDHTPALERIRILARDGGVLFDSRDLAKSAASPANGAANVSVTPSSAQIDDPEVRARLAQSEPSRLTRGFSVDLLVPADQYAILYSFTGSALKQRLGWMLMVGFAVLGAIVGTWARRMIPATAAPSAFANARRQARFGAVWGPRLAPVFIRNGRFSGRFHLGRLARFRPGLRAKFVTTIIAINALTGLIVFWTLSTLQTREETQRIQKESLLFAQFSTAQMVSDFSNFFYFYYADKFLPGVKTIIASNENLVGLRIISKRTGQVLFDSEGAQSGQGAPSGDYVKPVEFPPEIRAELKNRDLVSRPITRNGTPDGEPLLSVINTYRNENREALFYVEFLFNFASLNRSVANIRRQIQLDLLPALGLGLLIAVVFSQLLISPIRRLVAALQRVTAGDYDVSVAARATDEIGELVGAFNVMTGELRKKAELRKYLSDSTYRQIMEAPDTPGGLRIGGTRVEATVLFSDIRNFVGHCESLEAEEVTAMLNEYFSEMVEVVYKNGGEVDKFIGDALLAVFYVGAGPNADASATGTQGDSATSTSLRAIYCALEMRERLVEFNQRRLAKGKLPLDIGVGITHGEIISGPIGAKDRMDFTVIGDVVNLANRIEKLSKEGRHTKIVFSQAVEAKVRGLLECEELSRAPIRGKEESVLVYELVRIRDLDTLLASLESLDQALRLRAIELLGQSRNPGALEPILALLNDSVEATRLAAVVALSKLADIGDNQVIAALLKRMNVEPAEKVLASVVSAIGRICRDERIFALKPLLVSPNERIVANAIEAIGQSKLPEVVDLIVPGLSSRNNRVKANAAMALFAAGKIEVIDILKPMLIFSDPMMRSSAAFAIGELSFLLRKDELALSWRKNQRGTKVFLAELQECVPILVSLLRDPEVPVRRQAVIALGKIKDRSAVLPIIDMVEIDRDSREMLQDIAQALRSIGSHKLVREVLSQLM